MFILNHMALLNTKVMIFIPSCSLWHINTSVQNLTPIWPFSRQTKQKVQTSDRRWCNKDSPEDVVMAVNLRTCPIAFENAPPPITAHRRHSFRVSPRCAEVLRKLECVTILCRTVKKITINVSFMCRSVT